MTTSNNTFDIIVVGTGINGLSSAWQITELDPTKRVLVLEQFPFGHWRGSSHGHSRITRKLYAEDYYCDMMMEVYPMWDHLQELLGETLFIQCETVGFGSDEKISPYADALRKKGCTFDDLDKASAMKVYPQFENMADTTRFVVDPAGGILLADRCIRGLRKLLLSRGVEIRDATKVTSVQPQSANRVDVLTAAGDRISCGALILCTNTWTRKLLEPLGVQINTQPTKVCLTYWKIRPEARHRYDTKHFPTFVDVDHEVFGTPEYEYPGSIKVTFHAGLLCDPDHRDQTPYCDEYLAFMREYVGKHFPDLEPSSPSITDTCLYDSAKDRTYILDHHPEHKNIVFGCGFSGQGFKTGPLVGKILANMAMGKPAGFDIQPFSLAAHQQ